MAWVRLDDRFPEHKKFAAVGPLGIALQVAGLCYCNRNLTDGFIPLIQARRLLSWEHMDDGRPVEIAITAGMAGFDVDSEYVIDLLLKHEVWFEVENGYQIHDYHEYQPSKDSIMSERESAAQRQKKWRETKRNGVTDSVTNTVSNGPVTPTPYPYPTPSKRESLSTDSCRAEGPTDEVKVKAKEKARAEAAMIREVFDHWQTVSARPATKLTADRRAKIRARFQEGYTVDDLKRAIDGACADPHHSGDNDRGKRYDDIPTVLRSASKVDYFLDDRPTTRKKGYFDD